MHVKIQISLIQITALALAELTEGILQVLLSHQFEVFLYCLCGQCVFSEDEVFVLPTPVHL